MDQSLGCNEALPPDVGEARNVAKSTRGRGIFAEIPEADILANRSQFKRDTQAFF